MSKLGTEFEKALAREFGLSIIPGSGNKWYNQLDLKGRGFRWSLKATEKKSISISQDVIDEAVNACEGPSGDGSSPFWAFRIGDERYDMIMMRKSDFVALQAGEIQAINLKTGSEKAEERRRRSKIPTLFRHDD